MGFTDNGGAIHSVERIAGILCLAICFPEISHLNKVKELPDIEISVAAQASRMRGDLNDVQIEHVMPQRAYAIALCEKIEKGETEQQLIDFIKSTFRLVLLTKKERRAIDKINRSRMTPDRVAEAGIALYKAPIESIAGHA